MRKILERLILYVLENTDMARKPIREILKIILKKKKKEKILES